MANPLILKQAIIKLLGSGNEGKLPVPQKQIGPGPTIENGGVTFFGDDAIDAHGLNREAIEEVTGEAPTDIITGKRKTAIKSPLREDGTPKDAADLQNSRKILERETINDDFDSGAPRTAFQDDAELQSLDDFMQDIAGKAERKTKRAATQELDLEGKRFDEGVNRVEDVMVDEVTSDPLFPNPQHPSSATSKAIKDEARKTEINAEVQDVIGRFKQQFDVEKLKGANLKTNKVASRLQDAWKKLSTHAAGARAGHEASLDIVRKIDAWLHKSAGGPAPRVGPLSTQSAEDTMTAIGKDIISEGKPQPVQSIDQYGNRGLSDVNELGPKTTGNLENLLRRRQSGFKQSQTRLPPPVEGTLSTQDTLLNILRDIQQGKLGPIGQ